MKQGVITTSNGELIYKPLDSKNITTSLDEIKALAVGSVGEYDKMFEKQVQNLLRQLVINYCCFLN